MYFKNVHRRLMLSLRLLVFIALFMACEITYADMRFGVDGGTYQESRAAGTMGTLTQNAYDAYMYLSFKSGFPLYLTLGYFNFDSTENYTGGTFSSITSSNPYVGLTVEFWGSSPVSVLLEGFYSPFSSATIAQTSGSEQWEGTATGAKAAFVFNIAKYFKINASIIYANSTYTTKTAGNFSGKASFNDSHLLPALGFAFDFQLLGWNHQFGD